MIEGNNDTEVNHRRRKAEWLGMLASIMAVLLPRAPPGLDIRGITIILQCDCDIVGCSDVSEQRESFTDFIPFSFLFIHFCCIVWLGQRGFAYSRYATVAHEHFSP